MSSPSILSALTALVNKSVATIDSALSSKGLNFPEQASSFDPTSEAEKVLDSDPAVQRALFTLASASYELLIRARKPSATLLFAAASHLQNATLRSVIDLHIVELLREAGPEGLSSEEIGKRAKTNASKISRVLRYLCSLGIFTERSPGEIFANNRLSSLMDSKFSVAELQANPDIKYTSSNAALTAVIARFSDEGIKASAFFPETLLDPKTRDSGEPNESASSVSLSAGEKWNLDGSAGSKEVKPGKKLTAWEFYELPGQEARSARFNLGMKGAVRMESPDIIVKGFDWASLPENARVLDVGGGIGSVSLVLAKAFPKLRIVIQDRQSVVEDGLRHWKRELPEAIERGRVIFQTHDFFTPQPQPGPNENGPTVFLLRAVLHDWSNEYASKILRRLREAAKSDTTLISIDRLIPYMCRDAAVEGSDVPGLIKDQLPEPLPANLGGAYITPYFADINMLVYLNGQERTIEQTLKLFRGAGWKIERVYQKEGWGQFTTQIIAVPI